MTVPPNAIYPKILPKAVELRKAGYTNSEISEILGIGSELIRHWMGATPQPQAVKVFRPKIMHERAIDLRSRGYSIRRISYIMDVPKSTIQGWVMDKSKQATAATKVAQFRQGENNTPSNITDHKFETKGEWWERCIHCGMAEAAHAESVTSYDPNAEDDLDWRCPNCVTADIRICGHNPDTWYEDAVAINEEMSDNGREEGTIDSPVDLGGPGDVRSQADGERGQANGTSAVGNA